MEAAIGDVPDAAVTVFVTSSSSSSSSLEDSLTGAAVVVEGCLRVLNEGRDWRPVCGRERSGALGLVTRGRGVVVVVVEVVVVRGVV